MTLFEKIIAREIPSEIVYEDSQVIAIKDINPVQPGHFLVIPKTVSTSLIDIDDKDFKYLMFKAKQLAKEHIKKTGATGFKLEINNGPSSGQEVFHTHVHIIPYK